MKLTMLQWNISYQEDIRHVVDFLHDHPVDIICLQEMAITGQGTPFDHAPSFLSAQLGLHMHIQEIPFLEDGQSHTQANGIFTKLPITSTRYEWINTPKDTPGWGDQYRAYVEAELALPDGTALTVGTTQLSYTDKFQDTPGKQAETQALRNMIVRHSGRFLLGADLNATPPSSTVESLSQVLTDAGPNLIEPTWTTKPFSYHGFEAHALGWRLDYIFVSSDIAVRSSEILPTMYSDHLPILATVEL